MTIKIASWIIAILSVFTISCNLDLANPHSLKYDPKTFDSLAKFILQQKYVYEMDDFTRDTKSINGVPIKLKDGNNDNYVQYLNVVEDSLGLDTKIVNHLRIQLEETKLREFLKSGDSILFTVDGFLDNSWGFMYCAKPLPMDTTWFDFKGNSVKFVEEVNRNWKKVAIR
jgi:hypothetical protein